MDVQNKKQKLEGELLWEDLHQNGYVLVKNVVKKDRCEEILTEFFDYLEFLQPEFIREDRETWDSDNLPIRTRGLLQHFNCGFQPHAVHARSACLPVFESLFPNKELTCSFDGTSFAPRPKAFKFKDIESWEKQARQKENLHIDQTSEGLISIQGGLAVVDQPIDCKVFVVIPGSHLYHEEIMKIQLKYRLEDDKEKNIKRKNDLSIWYDEQWLIMNDEMLDFIESKGLKRTRIEMSQGDLVLWDSRSIHSSADFTRQSIPGSYRLQVFVSFAPRVPDGPEYDKEIEKRKKAFAEGRTSKHSAQQIRLFSKQPRIYKKPTKTFMKLPSYSEMTEKEQKFHGLVKY